jgi:hypothetical protein
VDHHSLARVFLVLVCGLQGAGTALIDLNKTHATHPGWMGHARFHVVWQTSTVITLSLIEIALVVMPGPNMSERFYVAAALAVAPMLGFFAALVTRGRYRGTLSDPGGISPVLWQVRGSQLRIDLNVVAEFAAAISLAAIVVIYRWR